ncbi:hypothetical protein HDU83_002232 [Entophlyctis luteolus]|nr:hypothetical protein HDU83_002232 [Entophlyctis luteolus]KAJ3388578.1 hypothetical protein HDU84_009676 [Entophlyctis sp. JEL0112]
MDSGLASRTWSDYDNVRMAMNALINTYESKLKQLNPKLSEIEYDLNDLFSFVDSINDIAVLVMSPGINAYFPHGRDWIKQQLRQAVQGTPPQ